MYDNRSDGEYDRDTSQDRLNRILDGGAATDSGRPAQEARSTKRFDIKASISSLFSAQPKRPKLNPVVCLKVSANTRGD
jgi:hypothetical protein